MDSTTLNNNWEAARYFLIRYVTNYESYDSDNLELPYQLIYAQSDTNVQKEHAEFVNSSNSKSPFATYGKDKYLTVNITSISRLNNNTVDIKFEKILHDRNSANQQIIQKEAIVKWAFTKAENTEKALERDPLGFKVTYYSANQVNV